MQSNLFVIVQQIAVLFFYIAIGFTVRMFKIISEEGEKSFASFIINITFSALIISSFATENDKSILLNIWMIGAVAIFSVLVLTLISIPAAKFINGKCKDDISISRLLIIFGNTGFLGLPIAFSIFGSKGVLYVTIYNFFQAILYWPIVLTLIQNTEKRSMASRLKFLINVPFFSMIIGFIIFLNNIQLPDVLSQSISKLGQCTIPLSLVLVGCTLKSILDNRYFPIIKMLKIGLFRLIIFPVLLSSIVVLIPWLDVVAKGTLIIVFSTPVSTSTVILAKQYNNNYKLSSAALLFTTLFCIITIPVISYFFIYLKW